MFKGAASKKSKFREAMVEAFTNPLKFFQFNSDEKTTAASLNLILCLLGSITSPIVVGAVIDEACVVWSEMKDGSDGNCLIYDNRGLVHAFLVLRKKIVDYLNSFLSTDDESNGWIVLLGCFLFCDK